MRLEGSCHCGAVTFTVDSHSPQPYMRCYCSICRKTAGSGGVCHQSWRRLPDIGRDGRRVHRRLPGDGRRRQSDLQRHFCKTCGSPLWCYSPRWPDLVHPHASAIDTALPKPAQFVDLMLGSAAPWVALHDGDNIDRFDAYPAESIEDWHKSRGFWVE